ncbi:hypothetical protein DBT_1980 [Dissulfuribacter thermophilus]|uniref:Uncharacterized protein n=1 Tax=Dissulfuribacter thermophilus TaxID=1156395 RepID=A0A1B9F4C1_9BACT|nr:hypothetical protein DBT_1980 [Dissulfuribacter thermophilus]
MPDAKTIWLFREQLKEAGVLLDLLPNVGKRTQRLAGQESMGKHILGTKTMFP